MRHSRYVESKRATVEGMWKLIVGRYPEVLDLALARVHAVHILRAPGGLFGLPELSFPALLESAICRVMLLDKIPQPDLWNRFPWMEGALDRTADSVRADHDYANALAAAQAFLAQPLTQPRFLGPPLTHPITAQTRFSRLRNRYYEST